MTKSPFKQHIADLALLLKRHGVRHAVICPGSRNAPLIQVFQRDPDFSCHSIVDERSAGYLSLGIARQSGEPVAVVTTSGTAALNLAPAVAEAYYQQIPLVILTADRPPEWPPQFGNQRINQAEIYRPNVKGFLNLADEPADKVESEKLLREVSELIGSGLTGTRGPVHINITLNEPLYETIGAASETARLLPITEVLPETERSLKITGALSETEAGIISSCLTSQKKVLLIAGMNAYSTEEKQLLCSLAEQYQVVVIAENITNLNSGPPSSATAQEPGTNSPEALNDPAGNRFISVPELLLASAGKEELNDLTPDLVVIFGLQVVSKRTRLFVQRLVNVPVISSNRLPVTLFRELLQGEKLHTQKPLSAKISSAKTVRQNPSASKSSFSEISSSPQAIKEPSHDDSPAAKISTSGKGTGEPSDNNPAATRVQNLSATNHLLTAWKKQEATAMHRAATFLTTAGFSNLTATAAILSQVPPSTTLHLGNSGAIRYSQLAPTRNDLTYYSNRGTSGIDGSLSAAVGAAMVSSGPHLAILGDLSFVYDSNAMWNKDFPKNLKIIVLNDQGGGIFRLLDGPSRMPFFGEFSVTGHPVNLQHLAEAFGLKHLCVSDMPGLKTALATLFSEGAGPAVLEVNTTKSENSAIFKQFFKSLQNE